MDGRLAVVVLVVVLAGCGSIAGDAGQDQTAAETLTPVPVPEETPEPASLPPGVTGDGVPNSNALFGAHLSALEGESYTLRVRIANDDEVSTHLFRVESQHRYLRSSLLGGYGQNVTSFTDGERVYIRSEFDGVPNYARGNVTERPTSHTVRLSKVFLRLEDAEVAKVLRDGEIHYRIRGRYDEHPRAQSLKDFSVHAVVSQEGLIRSLTASYTVEGSGGPTNVTRAFEYTEVGTTTVERPDWVRNRWGQTGNGSRISPWPPVTTD